MRRRRNERVWALVAVLLGVVILGEAFPPRALLAMVVIVGGVALVSLAPHLRKRFAAT